VPRACGVAAAAYIAAPPPYGRLGFDLAWASIGTCKGDAKSLAVGLLGGGRSKPPTT